MVILCDNDAGLVTKRAETAAQREALGREARILRVVAHPGVVQLVGVDGEPPDQLVFRLAEARRPRWSPGWGPRWRLWWPISTT
jgi:hypothetical protein